MSKTTSSAKISDSGVLTPTRSSRILLCIATAIASVSDLAAMLLLMIAGNPAGIFLVPLIALLADCAFFAVIFFVNFRFKYSRFYFCLFIVFYVAFTLIVMFNANSGATMTAQAITLWLVCHVLSVLVLVMAFVLAARLIRPNGLLAKIVFGIGAALSVLIVALYFPFAIQKGFFGQGGLRVVRPLLYEYDYNAGYYCVKSVLDGAGDLIEIPENFNGKPVREVDPEIFFADGVAEVRFYAKDVSFVTKSSNGYSATDERMQALENLSITASRDCIDSVKRSLYEGAAIFSSGQDANFELANKIVPCDLAAGENYVTFSYSPDSYEYMKGGLTTWFGQSGETLDVSQLNPAEFLQHVDLSSDDDLDWNFKNNDSRIFSGAIFNGRDLNGSAITQSCVAEVSFDPIGRVHVKDGNDSKHNFADSLTRSVVNGERQAFKYVTASQADGFVQTLSSREGFDVDWASSLYDNGYPSSSSFAGDLSLDTQISRNLYEHIYIYPRWEMRAPTIVNYDTTASSSGGGYSVTYGKSFHLECVATPALDAFSLSYQWSGGSSSSTSSVDHASMPWSSSRITYNVTVTSSSSNSSLTSQTTGTVQVTVDPKALRVTWGDPSDLVYNAAEKTLTCTLNSEDIINSDSVSWTAYGATGFTSTSGAFRMKKAGTYEASIQLSGSDSEKYYLPSSTHTVTISRKEITAKWLDTECEYDGARHLPSVSVEGSMPSDSVTAVCNESSVTQRGNYTISARLTGVDSDNYRLSSSSSTTRFTITPRTITLQWSSAPLTYNASAQHPDVTGADRLASGDELSDLRVSYGGWTNNVAARDGYSVTASISNNNYQLSGGSTKTYSIAKKAVTLQWSANSLTYTASAQHPNVTAVTGNAESDPSSLIRGITYGAYSGNVDVKSGYSVTASLNNDNYVVNDGSDAKTYSIEKAQVAVRWSNTSPVYNGKTQMPTASVTPLGSDRLSVNVSGGGITAGSHEATAAVTGDKANNYDFTNLTLRFKIAKRPVTLVWESKSFTYNAAAQYPTVTSANGLADGQSLSDLSLTYSGWQSNVNAGSHIVTAVIGNDNYVTASGSYTHTYNIAKARLTVTVKVTATASGGRPEIGGLGASYSVSGLQSGDEQRNVIDQVTFKYLSDDPSSGDYLKVGADVTLKNSNYEVTVVSATVQTGE